MRGYFLKACKELVFLIIYPVSLIFPRSDRIWVFGCWAGKKYSDNTRYLYEFVCDQELYMVPIWITSSDEVLVKLQGEGRRCYKRWSIKGVFFTLRASLAFVTHDASDINGATLGGATLISLTHGVPMKKIGLDAQFKRLSFLSEYFDRYIRSLLPSTRRSDFIFVASEFSVSRFASSIGGDSSCIIPLGYPRWDPIYQRSVDSRTLERLCGDSSLRILYAPTHRKAGREPLLLRLDEPMKNFIDWLEINDACLIIRPHFASMVSDLGSIIDYGRGRVVLADNMSVPDVYDIIAGIDVLVADYSSIIYDFAILERPIISLVPDMEDYVSQDAGLYEDYEFAVPGPIISSWSEFSSAFDYSLSPVGRQNSHEFKVRHAANADGQCSRRVLDFALSLVG